MDKTLKEKKHAFKDWSNYSGTNEDMKQQLYEIYKESRKRGKIEVAKAMNDASKNLYDGLETTETTKTSLHQSLSTTKVVD